MDLRHAAFASRVAAHIRLTDVLQFANRLQTLAASNVPMKTCFSVLLAVMALSSLATFRASAHPGSGIVIDAQGRVYFSEAGDIDAHLPGAIWQIDGQGKLSR